MLIWMDGDGMKNVRSQASQRGASASWAHRSSLGNVRSGCVYLFVAHGCSWIMGKGWESWIQDLVSFCRCSWLIGVGDLLIEDA